MYRAYEQPGGTLAGVAERFGVSKNAVWMAFNRYRLPMRAGGNGQKHTTIERPRQMQAFCGQCERRVCAAEAAACVSRWCKAKEIAA
jgi:hypothetical protein